jgi:VWFA-related protein
MVHHVTFFIESHNLALPQLRSRYIMAIRVLLSLLLLTSIVVDVVAQQPQPSPAPAVQKPVENAPDLDQEDVVRITTNLVQVDVVVTDKNGKLVTDLNAEDFEIFEDGKPQSITNFSFISNMPERSAPEVAAPPKSKDKFAPPVLPAKIDPNAQRRVVALVVDDLGMTTTSIRDVKKQLAKFIDTLAPNDLVAIIRTGGDVGSLQQFTNDRRLLHNAIDRLRWNQCSRAGLHAFAPAGMEGNTGSCFGTLLKTIKSLRFILRGMDYVPGRKSMVLFSDSIPIQDQEHTSGLKASNQPEQVMTSPLSDAPSMSLSSNYYEQLQRLAEIAIRSSVVIYGVDTRALMTTGLMAADAVSAPSATGSNMRSIQAQVAAIQAGRSRALIVQREGADLIAKQTGGFLIKDSNNFQLERIMEDQKGYYLLGFRPAEETFNSKFHNLKVRLKRKGLTVRTRKGFYGYTDEQARPANPSVADAMNRALLFPFGANAVNVRLSSYFVDDATQGPVLRSFVYIDPHDLTFTEEADGWRVANIDLRSVLFGDNGKVIEQKDLAGTLRFRGAEYTQVMRDGVVYGFDVPIKQLGAVQFRVAVRDTASLRIGAAGQFIEVPNLQKGDLAISGIFLRGLVERKTTVPATQSSLTTDNEIVSAGPGVRHFRQGSTLVLGYAIYNTTNQKPAALTTQMRLFRDGKPVLVGEVVPVNLDGQADPRRIIGASALQLDSKMEPGEYIVQIIATNSSSQKARQASQWIDFEVVK